MRFGIGTLKRTISALLVGIVLFVGMAVPAEAQRRGRRNWDRHDNGRHLGWTRGRHLGWRNNRNRHRDDDWRERRLRRRAFRRERREDRREWRDERLSLLRRQRMERRDFRRRHHFR